MAGSVLTLFASNPQQSGSSAGLLQLSAPTASTSTTGWTVGTTVATRYSRQTYNTEKAAATFGTVVEPSGPPQGLGMDTWRTSAATSGVFSAGTWYSSLSVIAVTASTAQRGAALFRIWKTPNLNGTSTGSRLASDDFGRADQSPIAGNWTSHPGTFGDLQITSNDLIGSAAGDNAAYYSAIAWPNDQYAECQISATGSDGGPMVRIAAGAKTGYLLDWSTSVGLTMYRISAGVFTNIQTISGITQASGDTFRLEAIGPVLRAYKIASGGTLVQVGTDVVDTNIASGNAGVFIFDGTSTFTVTNWEGGAPTMVELTKSRMTGSTLASTLLTTVAQSSSASTQISAVTLNNEYLFWQTGWQTTTAGTGSTSDVLIRLGSLTSITGTGLITSSFSVFGPGGSGGPGPLGGQYYYNMMADWFNR